MNIADFAENLNKMKMNARVGTGKNRYEIAMLVILVMSLLIGLTCGVAMAEDTPQFTPSTLRVAYYPLDGFFEYDSRGVETGYGVELLNKISQYTGLQFEYVPATDWESTKLMLLDGKADIRMPATMPLIPSSALSYSATSIIDTYHVLLALDTRDDLYYQDYETIGTLRIAISGNFYHVTTVKTYLDRIGIAKDQLVFCEDYDECHGKLVSGEVDALVSNIMDMDGTMKMLARFNSISNYFSMTLDNPVLDVLDETMAQIKLDEPLFLANLYSRWFPERTVVPLTIEESEYLASIDTLTFAFRTSEGYLSRREDDGYYGIYVEQAKSVCDRLGIGFDAVSLEDCLDGRARADVYSGFFYNQNYAEEWGLCISAPINNINYYLIQKKEKTVNETTCKIAAREQFYYTREYLQHEYRAEQFLYFNTYEECLQAVAGGQADIAIINNYIAEYYLEMYQFSNLSARLTSEYSHLYCFATVDQNKLLASILTKTLSAITTDEMNQMYIRGMEKKPKSNFFLAFLYQNPLLFTLAVAGLSILLIVIVLMLVFIRNSRIQNRTLENALAVKSDFLARMSHDMRTPLNAVLGFTKLAQDEKDDSQSVQDSLAKIQSSSEYLLGLINDVLDASKIESGKVELHSEIVNGVEFLRDITEEFKAQGKLRRISLVVDLTKANTPFVKMDKLRTRQVYSNLLNNAFKFSEPGSTVEWYMEDTKLDDSHMEFVTTITDHGCGMSAEFMQHMFEPFTQEITPGKGLREGTGLGLMIVKKFVELMNGTIDVQSELGVGTTFTIRMRRDIPSKDEVAAFLQSEKIFDVDISRLEGKRLLLCEDHPLNREIAVRLLAKVGVSTECAMNGQIGVDMFKASTVGHYDAILMDIRMPVMNGLDAAEAIRKTVREDARTIPIIAVTANAYNEDVVAALQAGMNTHIPKPLDPKTLYKTLSELIS